MKKQIVIFGSTGSIGKTLINILKKDKKSFEIKLLTANKNTKELLKQVRLFEVKNIIITNRKKFLLVQKLLINKKINIYNNFNSIPKIFKNKKIDYTMNSLSGLDGLYPTLKIIKFTKKIAIANKESIICGWSLIKKELTKYKTEFIPIDSEHFSIWSLTKNANNNNIEKIYITASGGPFIKLPLNKFKFINQKSAINHPNWSMGKKISIDSATMMNKVFEIIEARKIFNFDYKKIEVLIHPKSYVHAVVKFNNGLSKILIHDTNMTIPIFNSIYPNFIKKIKSKKLDLDILNNLNFSHVDKKRFPITQVLKNLPNHDSLYETILVAANDKLVQMFLDKKIKFSEISQFLLRFIVSKEFNKYKSIKPSNIKEIEKLRDYVSLKIETKCV
jgi:1-deoxy-D-xylulose-5-phosphate reductoisomerase